MKQAAIIIGFMLVPVLAARGQVAAPGLLPIANPAALAWEFSPVVMSTVLLVEQSAKRNSAPAPDREGSGNGVLLRARYPGEALSLGGQFLHATVELGDSATGTTRQGLRTYALGFATRVGERIALGAGVESFEESEESGADEFKLGTFTTLVGVSLRLAEVFFLASVHGQRKLVSNIPEQDGQLRNMSRVAAGLRWFNSAMLVHAEYIREDSPPFREISFAALPGFTFDVLDTQVDTVVAEIVFQGVFLGYTNADTITLGHPLKNETIRTQLFTLGVMPPSGLIVTWTYRLEETDDRVKKTVEELEIMALGIAWRF